MAYFSREKVLFSWIVLMLILVSNVNAKCAWEAVFVIGDSNSDTGGFFAAFPSQSSPYGMTYFGSPAGRSTDGRNYVDFLSQGLGIPFISPYLQSIGSDFRHGANFATSASTVLQPTTSLFVNGVSPFYLTVQLNQLKNLKARSQGSKGQGNLPAGDVWGRSLYVIHIGQNDFTGYVSGAGPGGVKDIGPQVISQIQSAIKEIYNLGGRTILVLNLAPVGCYPAFITQFPHQSSDLDKAGCMTSYNNAVNEYNSLLKQAVQQTRGELHDANVLYVDLHSVLLELFQNPKAHGMQHGTVACCGYGGGSYNYNQQVFCGNTKDLNGQKATASACSDPQNYVSWDGVHVTEAANKILTDAILSGSSIDPKFAFNQYCDIQPIG